MSLTHEFRRDLRQREEESALSYAQRFQVPGTGGGESGEILCFMVPPQRDESVTKVANFTSTAETISAQGSLVLEDFSGRVLQPFSSLPNIVVVPSYDWPLQAKPSRGLVFGDFLNSLLWLDEFQRAKHEEGKRKGLVLSEEVLQFCSQHRLLAYLLFVAKLVNKCFPSLIALEVEMECDPESDDEWLHLTARLHESVETVLTWYDTYTRRFINAVPWPQRNKIRFSYDLT